MNPQTPTRPHLIRFAVLGGLLASITIWYSPGTWKEPVPVWVLAISALGFLACLAVVTYRTSQRRPQTCEVRTSSPQELTMQLRDLQRNQSQLIQSARMASVSALATGVAHGINNPVFAILGRAELLLQDTENHLRSDTAVQYVQVIHDMAERISTMVKQLIDYSRPVGEMEPTRVTAAMDAATNLVGQLAIVKGIEVHRDYQADPEIQAVPSMLQQAFVNLLLNAIEATPPGGHITLSCVQGQDSVICSVRDSGEGIPSHVMHHLFEPFFTTKVPGKNTGLGLFLCHRIAAHHGGHIQVESTEGIGTCVTLELPLQRPGERVLAHTERALA